MTWNDVWTHQVVLQVLGKGREGDRAALFSPTASHHHQIASLASVGMGPVNDLRSFLGAVSGGVTAFHEDSQ